MDKTEKITIRISKELKDKVFDYCEEKDIPVSQWIRDAIKEKLKEEK